MSDEAKICEIHYSAKIEAGATVQIRPHSISGAKLAIGTTLPAVDLFRAEKITIAKPQNFYIVRVFAEKTQKGDRDQFPEGNEPIPALFLRLPILGTEYVSIRAIPRISSCSSRMEAKSRLNSTPLLLAGAY